MQPPTVYMLLVTVKALVEAVTVDKPHPQLGRSNFEKQKIETTNFEVPMKSY